MVVAKQPGEATALAPADRLAVQLGQAVDERAVEQLGARVVGAVVLLVGGGVAQAEVARQVDDARRVASMSGTLWR